MGMQFRQLKELLRLKERFYSKRHSERLQLVNIRFDLTKKLIELKDNVSMKMFAEKLTLIEKKINRLK